MTDEVKRIGLTMVRENLDSLPVFPVPRPYLIRSWRPGDDKNWLDIHIDADPYSEITPGLFEEQFGSDERELAARQLYLCNGAGRAVGTATAWRNVHFPGMNMGRVHWVAIVGEHQGRGLAKPLLCACLERLVELGCDGAYLTTLTVRLPALNLYLAFGFTPHIATERDAEGWRLVRNLVRPQFLSAIDGALERTSPLSREEEETCR